MKKLLFLFLLTPLLVTSQIPEPEKGTYINDNYGYLSTHERLEINKQLRTIEDSTGVQVAIIVIPGVPDKYSIEDYAREIGRKWHVGNAKNGIVYVAAIEQRKQRMEVASHLEGTITDATAGRLIASTKPYFRTGKYAAGISYMVTQLQIELLKDKVEQLQLTADELKKKKAQDKDFWLWVLIWPACFSVLSIIIFRIIRKRREERRRKEQEELIKRTNQQLAIEKRSYELAQQSLTQHQANQQKRNNYSRPATRSNIISDDPALLYTPPIKSDVDDNKSSGSSGYSGGYSSGSSDSGSSSSSSSDYGSWGSGSSDSGSSSSDSGYSGGGASDSW